ncbi:MAG: hypothetical protein OHK0046_24260 [Anaerolineae bacterium]
MAKKTPRFGNNDLFEDTGNTESSDARSVDQEIFGSPIFNEIAQADSRAGERIQKVNIFQIFPDPTQPRRAIPSQVRQTWDGTPKGLSAMFEVWLELIQEERDGEPLDLHVFFSEVENATPDEDGVTPSTLRPVELAFLKVVDLAVSIRRDGLTNPITVIKDDTLYQLETGERRWLAFHLLHNWFDGSQGQPDERDKWKTILAREVDKLDRWRQAAENNARTDLNAIGKARQWALLVMHLDNKATFKAFNRFSTEREFYAQALGVSNYGQGEKIRNALGVSSRSALSRYRSFLKLPDDIWQMADDLNIAEEPLYKTATIAEKESEEKARAYFFKNVLGQNISTAKAIVAVSENNSPGTKRHFMTLKKLLSKAEPGKVEESQQALEQLQELRRWLEAEEKRIKNILR